MSLPYRCTASNGSQRCPQTPSFAVSISADSGEFLVGVVCADHQAAIADRLAELQKAGQIPSGELRFQSLTMVSTDCVTGNNEDYVDIELKRGLDSDRRATD